MKFLPLNVSLYSSNVNRAAIYHVLPLAESSENEGTVLAGDVLPGESITMK